ncbi:cytochrome c oxidase subunit 3 [Aidingimonas halophila]|uniref:cytochrome-c oxidase n=1 Tax=Aidingimonas halophila TaxID=574349 RepID=A0A1H3BYR9_9GAMM|nr:cytochrome c oxidase subunit 3 [Aidingimonas halophila]GHC27331.1 cytochrome c oxidase subunit III [Aidingimonas halophila]SDX46941.1 cytochrome c oxidase subunit 3 [Aidingimonas halophila]
MSGSYYVPETSKWPALGSAAVGLMMIGMGVVLVHGVGSLVLGLGTVAVLAVMWFWFRDVVIESRQGLYDAQMDRSFRWGMGWFIFSEVMFFAAFFGTLYYVRVFALPWLDGEGAKGIATLLWPDFTASWPLMNPPDSSISGPRDIVSPWQLPLVNTLFLVASSITLTVSHEALKEGLRATARNWLIVTLALGACFLVVQGVEYYEAYTHYGITLDAGIYGSTFFLLTGFHGFHVTVGVVTLAVMLGRILKGHFSRDDHFAFEAGAWYWHFVDVVWIGLFLFVYVF